MPNNPWRVSVTLPSSTGGFPLFVPDTDQDPDINIGIFAVISTAAAANVAIEHSPDYTGSSAFISSNATWFSVSGASAVSASTTVQFTIPTSIIRVNSSTVSSSLPINITIIQAG